MKIIDIRNFINKLRFLNESMSLNDLRKRLLSDEKGEGKSLKIFKKEQKWYDENKRELIKNLNMIVGKDKEDDLKSLVNLDTEPYFINKELKPKTLYDDLGRKISATKSRVNYTKSNNSGISNQYEMIELSNGVELYAVYTPVANSTLTHKILKTKTQPTWCIASSSASYYWNYYKLYNAYYPAVFIVAQKLSDGTYNDMKYELKCSPKKTQYFAHHRITLPQLVDEWRNPTQTERTYKETSLFNEFKITLNELTDGVRKLMTSEKGKSFSKNFGKDMMDDFNFNIKKNKNNNERIKFLIKACQNGTFQKFHKQVKKDEREFFIDRLIEYNNLFEEDVDNFEQYSNKKAILNLAKNKRCSSSKSLKWAADNFDESTVKKVVFSIDEDRLEAGLLDILWSKNMNNIADIFVQRLIDGKLKYSWMILDTVLKHNKEEYLKPILKLFKKRGDIHNSSLGIMLRHNKNHYIKSFLDIIAKSKTGLTFGTLDVICHFKKLKYIPYVLDYIVKNDKSGDTSFIVQYLLHYNIDKKYIYVYLNLVKDNDSRKLKNMNLISTFIKHEMSDELLWCLDNCDYAKDFDITMSSARFFDEFLNYNDNLVFKNYIKQVVRYFKNHGNRDDRQIFSQLLIKCFRYGNNKKSKIFIKEMSEGELLWGEYDAFIKSLLYDYEELTKYILNLLNERYKKDPSSFEYEKSNIMFQLERQNKKDLINYVEKFLPELIGKN